MSKHPTKVVLGQVWHDNDDRTATREFTVVALVGPDGEVTTNDETPDDAAEAAAELRDTRPGTAYAVVRRGRGLYRSIKTERLLDPDPSRGYTYIGMGR